MRAALDKVFQTFQVLIRFRLIKILFCIGLKCDSPDRCFSNLIVLREVFRSGL